VGAQNTKTEALASVLLCFVAPTRNRTAEAVDKINFLERSEGKFRLVAEPRPAVLNKI